jgi:pimeloyl-ACP methyl ester carboxylesterase
MRPIAPPRIHLSSTSVVIICILLSGLSAHSQQADLDRLVDGGGYKLHLKCVGHGAPLVIFESGLGGNADSWAKVMPAVGQTTRACSYDRANVGSSDPAHRATAVVNGKKYLELRDGDSIVRDLHTLLSNAGEHGPYIFVGHSLGGLYAVLYAARYPSDVEGMVLEDPAHPDQSSKYGAIVGSEKAEIDHDGLIQNEEGADIDSVFGEVKSLHWHTQIPLTVLSQGSIEQSGNELSPEQWNAHREAHRAMQASFLLMSTKSKWIIADKSGHLIHRDQPELVVNAIEVMLNSLRGTTSTDR